MKRNILIAILLVHVGAGGAYIYLRASRTTGEGGSGSQMPASEFCAKHQIAEKECPWCDPSLVEKKGQCAEHGVPEALCAKCNPKLVAGFKAEGDWCGGHGVPESQCEPCKGGECSSGETK